MKRQRAVMIGLASLFLLMFGAGTASATETARINQTLVTAGTSTQSLTLSNSLLAVRCNLTITATFASQIVLNLSPALQKIGRVTSGAGNNCIGARSILLLDIATTQGGRVQNVSGLATATTWDITFVLPLPTLLVRDGDGVARTPQAEIRILDAGISVTTDGPVCLYRGNLRGVLSSRGDRLRFLGVNNVAPVQAGLSVNDPFGLCAAGGAGTIDGELVVTNPVTVTLTR